MLRIISSNRQEALLDALAERLRAPADGNPLAPERVVAERGMNTWLLQQLAERHGIAANIEFEYPAAFVWQTLRALVPDLPKQSRFDAAPLAWRLLRLVPSLLAEPAFQAIRRYLADDADGRKRYQLCGRVAAAFNDYLVYRPAMLLGWAEGRRSTDSPDEPWQMRLWQAATAELGDTHRARLLQRFAALPDTDVAAAEGLPRRVSVFGVPALPPVYVGALARLARSRDVDLYVLNPSEEFWGDLVDPKRLAADPDALAYGHDLPNRLLASWGQPVRFFLSELYAQDAEYLDAWEGPAGPATLLGRIQADVRALTETTSRPLDPDDDSLLITSAWGPLREVEALHDWLLDRFQRDPTLRPRDVVVYAPDIDAYAPYVDAVFGAAAGTPRHLPWLLADVPPRARHPLLAVVEQLLRLPESRFRVSEVLGLLETPAIARRFGLGEADLSVLREALRAVHAHWGLDAAMRRELVGLGAEADRDGAAAHTWEFALRRLFLGVATGAADAPLHGVVPAPLFEGQGAAALGRLQAFVDRLAHWRRALMTERPPAEWVRTVHAVIDDLVAPADADDEAALEQLVAALGAFDRETGEGGFAAPLSAAVFRDDLFARLATPDERGRLFDGRITVAALTPMRSVPFRLVGVLGLGSEAFPRGQAAAGFDLIAHTPRPGDRSRRLDDRHLFLETLLSARDALYLSYTGRNPKDGSAAQPSVVVSELLDYVVQMHGGEPQREAVIARFVVEHPLQPFSRRYFGDAGAGLYTYDTDWVGPAREAVAARADRAPFCPQALPARDADADAGAAELPVEALVAFLCRPAAVFLRERLGIAIGDDDAPLGDDEPFALDGLDAYRLKAEWLDAALAGRDVSAHEALVRGRGDLPEGAFGELAWGAVADAVEPMAEVLAPRLAEPRSIPVRLDVAGRRLVGTLQPVTAEGLVRYTVASSKPRYLLASWVWHLVLLATAPEGVAPRTHLVTGNEVWLLDRVDDPLGELARLVQLHHAGLREPLPFFPASSYAWLESSEDQDKARNKALAAWEGNDFQAQRGITPEGLEAANRICWGHRADPFAPGFEDLARSVYGPLRRAASKAGRA